jgi:hypothetical protein
MGKGFFSPHTTGVTYTQEFSPWRSPSMWKSACSIFAAGFITAGLLIAFMLGGQEQDKAKKVAPVPTVTVTVNHTEYKAPVGHE